MGHFRLFLLMISEKVEWCEVAQMGGLGSGLRSKTVTWPTVEGCLTLDVNPLARAVGGLGRPASGRVDWAGQAAGSMTCIGFRVEPAAGGGPILRLCYAVTLAGRETQPVNLPVRLQTTHPQFGGVRWWFTCPLAIDGRPCNRRVGKLHLPPGAAYFGCRGCHGLTYRSRRVQSQSTA